MDTGGADPDEYEDLEDDEWLEGAEDDDDEPLEEDEEWCLWDGGSLGWGFFLGMVKLDLVTLNAPVTWIGPGGKGDEVGVGPGFLDLAEDLLGGVAAFLDALELVD